MNLDLAGDIRLLLLVALAALDWLVAVLVALRLGTFRGRTLWSVFKSNGLGLFGYGLFWLYVGAAPWLAPWADGLRTVGMIVAAISLVVSVWQNAEAGLRRPITPHP